MNTLPEIPPEVTGAANLVADWMKRNGHTRWELLEICSRNHAAELETARHELSMIAADVEAFRTDCSTPVFQMVRNLKETLKEQRETHIMQLAAISVAANSNTESTLEQALKCHPDYKTVALSVVVVAIQREIWERNQKDQWRAVAEQAVEAMKSMRPLEMGKAVTAYEKLKGQP